MPLFARSVRDERDALLTFLDQQRVALRAAVLGLSDEQARATPTISTLSLGGLIKHAGRTERRWAAAGIVGEPLPGLWPPQDWTRPTGLRADLAARLAPAGRSPTLGTVLG